MREFFKIICQCFIIGFIIVIVFGGGILFREFGFSLMPKFIKDMSHLEKTMNLMFTELSQAKEELAGFKEKELKVEEIASSDIEIENDTAIIKDSYCLVGHYKRRDNNPFYQFRELENGKEIKVTGFLFYKIKSGDTPSVVYRNKTKKNYSKMKSWEKAVKKSFGVGDLLVFRYGNPVNFQYSIRNIKEYVIKRPKSKFLMDLANGQALFRNNIIVYRIKRGDTLSGIARLIGFKAYEVKAIKVINPGMYIIAG